MCVLDILRHVPCCAFSRKQNTVIHWAMLCLGLNKLPSESVGFMTRRVYSNHLDSRCKGPRGTSLILLQHGLHMSPSTYRPCSINRTYTQTGLGLLIIKMGSEGKESFGRPLCLFKLPTLICFTIQLSSAPLSAAKLCLSPTSFSCLWHGATVLAEAMLKKD
jgi:hypothetical protein